jgi:hypothetical protein
LKDLALILTTTNKDRINIHTFIEQKMTRRIDATEKAVELIKILQENTVT